MLIVDSYKLLDWGDGVEVKILNAHKWGWGGQPKNNMSDTTQVTLLNKHNPLWV